MGSFEIIKRNGKKVQLQTREPFCAVKSAVQNTSLMGDDNVQLSFVSRDLINLEKGDKILVFGEEYTLRTKASREILSETHYTYEATFYGVMYELMKSLYRNTDANGKSTKSTFDLTYSIKDFIKVLIYNVERDYPGLWKFDEANCPDTEPITLQFSKQNCLQVLQTLCSKENFNLEFRITQANGVRTIHIGKFGSKVVPPGGNAFFEWGKGNGLYKLKEEKVDDKAIITRLWVEGGTTNIRSGYRGYSERLQLPYPKRLNKKEHTLADGTVIPAESEYIGIDDDAKRYFEDAELREMLGSDEDSKEYDNIHPTRTGEVTALVDGDVNSFIDNTMDFDLCEKDADGTKYLISGVAAKINFISGKLAGQQFEIATDGGYIHSEKKFKLIPFTDERGLTIPTTGTNEAFRISVGDRYKITDINLPESYEQAAEEDLWYAGYDDFIYMKQARAQYQLTLDRKYFVDSLPEDSDTTVFKVGDYVPVRDTRFGIEKNIRIQKVSRNLLLEHDYALTLSDVTAISVYSQTVVDVIKHNQIIENNRLRDLNKARKGWRTTEELRNMVYDTDGYFDPENIRPNSIDTNMLTVGSKSQQFVLIDVVLEPNVSGLGNRLNASAGVLAHLSVEEDGVRQWSMGASEFTMANSGGYYLFAKCSKTGDSGVWHLTQKQLKFEPTDDPNNYYFQVGILSSLYEDGFRDFVTTYGFTRINGNTITTGKIVTSDGECYLDLDGNKFRIGDANSCIDWGVTAKGQLTLKNVRLLSQSGDTSHLGVYRGTYNSNYVYYPGDEVDYTNGGETCTYRYINANPTAGNAPTNSVYWAVIAKGSKGETGNSVFYTYNDSQSKPATPTGSGNTNGWHTESTESVVWMSIKTAKTIADGTWGTPFRVRGADGTSITIKGTVTSVSQLPATGNENGDAYLLDGYLYIWTGISWSNVGKIQGEAGKSSYLHKKYSDDGGKTFTAGNGETPGRWLGLYVDQIATDSDDPAKYTWSDTKGEQGIPGEPGEDGRTTYLHIKYSNDGGLSFTDGNGETPGSYIGQYTDYELMDSDDPTRYTWAKIKGDSGTAGTDASVGDYYEYRYAKNGSTSVPPEIDKTAINPHGWSTQIPDLNDLEYLWCTIAKKSGIADITEVYIPVNPASLLDMSWNGYDGELGKDALIINDGDRCALKITGTAEAAIPYDLPFGKNFTLCLWLKTDQAKMQWMFNGFNGRDYEENSIDVTANTWLHLAFRFNDRTVSVFKNGVLLHSANLSEQPVGFSLYDDNMFGSTILFDDIRILNGALPVSDIIKVMNGASDLLIQNWSTPVRINPYDGKDAISVKNVDVEYAITESNVIPPETGWETEAPTWENGKFIWSRTKITFTNEAEKTTNPVCITGSNGNTGEKGESGLGVKSIVEEYYLSSSATALLNGTWSSSRPEWKDKYYIWTRSVITYTDNTTHTTDAICVTGSKGDKGDSGVGVSSVTEYYLASSKSSGITTETSGWTTSIQTITSTKRYLWNYEKITYSDGKESDTEPAIIGVYGESGKQGVGISSITEYYLVSEYNTGITIGTSGWGKTIQKLTSSKRYLWNYEEIEYTNGDGHTTDPIIIGVYGDKGDKGDSGVGISSITEYYLASSKSSGITTETSGWTTSIQTITSTKRYLWNYEKITYSDGTTVNTTPVMIGVYGAKGDSGVGISSITEYYLASSESSGVTTETTGWTTSIQTITSTKRYLWNYEKITYSDGTTVNTTPVMIGVYGDKGDKGDKGDNGDNGVNQGSNLLYNSSFLSKDRWSLSQKVSIVSGLDNTKAVYCTCDANTESINMAQQELFSSTIKTIATEQWYTLSFWAKGSGSMASFVYPNTIDNTHIGKIDGVDSWLPGDARAKFSLTNEWAKHSVTFKTKNSISTGYLLFRLYAGSSAYICMPKLEKGKYATDWCVSEMEKLSPSLVYRGVYNGSALYYGNTNRVDAVSYNGVYYVARVDAGEFSGKLPTDMVYWNTFGAQFESVATSLLLADKANIGGMIFHNNRLESQKTDENGDPVIIIDGVNGDGKFFGMINCKLFYGRTLKVPDTGTYVIDPLLEPAFTYFIDEPDDIRIIRLPDANLYDGLEIQVFTKNSRESMWMPEETYTLIGCNVENQILYAKLNIYSIPRIYIAAKELKYQWDKHFAVEHHNSVYSPIVAPYTMMMLPNSMYKFKAMNGAWYVLEGLWTGE